LFAIVNPGITAGELRSLADGGVRGVRFSLAGSGASPPISPQTIAEIDALSRRVNELGWHVQFNIDAAQIVAIQNLLDRLPATIVLDHMGHMPQPAGMRLVWGSNWPHPNETAKPDDAALFNCSPSGRRAKP
jgi:D-galactarolactone isomerase